MRTEVEVLEDIEFARARQAGFLQKISGCKTEIANAERSISSLSVDIELYEDELWWLRFLRFCNTPCWWFLAND